MGMRANETQPSATKIDPNKIGSSRVASAAKSTVLLLLTLYPLTLVHDVAHEGGHALVNLIYRIPHTSIYVHPFSFSGYSRPIVDLGTIGNAWSDAAGPIAGVLLPLAVFIPLWKHRSVATLPLVMLFPWAVLFEGLNAATIFLHTGDFFNMVRGTGLPATPFMMTSIILLIIGLLLSISIFPLLGIKTQDTTALFAVPVGMLLWALPGFGIAHWIVPGSPIDVQYQLGPEIIQTANLLVPLAVVVGIVLALIYATLYPCVYRRLAASMRTEAKELAWRDLRWPAVWFVASVVIGMILIR